MPEQSILAEPKPTHHAVIKYHIFHLNPLIHSSTSGQANRWTSHTFGLSINEQNVKSLPKFWEFFLLIAHIYKVFLMSKEWQGCSGLVIFLLNMCSLSFQNKTHKHSIHDTYCYWQFKRHRAISSRSAFISAQTTHTVNPTESNNVFLNSMLQHEGL